jgi:hypothetical protein
MKIMVATKQGQGIRKNDFCHATEGELVGFAMECDGESVDGHCGCRRSMSGMVSHMATTTMKVVELPLTLADVTKAVTGSLISGGWMKDENDIEYFNPRKDAEELARIAATFEVGDIVEKRGNKLQTRVRA